MEISNQIWKDRDLTPLVDNKVDLVVIDETPTCQVEIYNFLSQYYEVCPQDPLNQIFVSIQNNPAHRDSLRSERQNWRGISMEYTKKGLTTLQDFTALTSMEELILSL